MAKFRKKPVVIEAMELTKDSLLSCVRFIGPESVRDYGFSEDTLDCYIEIKTLEGVMMASDNDWIIKGVSGEFYPCKPDIFALTYEPLDDMLEKAR